MNADYVVIRDGQVVQEINAMSAAGAEALQTAAGQLYCRVGRDFEEEIANAVFELEVSLP